MSSIPQSAHTKTAYYVYMIRCADYTLYTGITTDVTKRVAMHNTSVRGAKYTRGRRPVVLVYSAMFPDRASALQEEVRIKRLKRAEKLSLLTQ